MEGDGVCAAEVGEEVREGECVGVGEVDGGGESAGEGEERVDHPSHEIEYPADGAGESVDYLYGAVSEDVE